MRLSSIYLVMLSFFIFSVVGLRSNAAAEDSLVASEIAGTLPPPDEHEVDDKAVKEIMKITDKGLAPAQVILRKKDGSVFFVNTTSDSLLTLKVDYGKRRTHCASDNLKMGADGLVISTKPIGPKDFALMCFPEPGTYKVQIAGLAGKAKEIIGSVVVTP